ncbi:MAG: hydroxymethylglutaryl-CoA reductase [Thermoplasmata archaeon]|nr:hydroxymethylglutaryl-CoA reductase [Thermoplasmata archaeon]
MKIPSMMIKQLYTYGSLFNVMGGVKFTLKNKLSDAILTGISKIVIDGVNIPLEKATLTFKGDSFNASSVDADNTVPFPKSQEVEVLIESDPLPKGAPHDINLEFKTKPFGMLNLEISDNVDSELRENNKPKIPHNKDDNTSAEIVKKRQEFIEEFTGKKLDHLTHFSVSPEDTRGNIENFTGVAQVPIGIAGPLKVNGEYAQGEFLIPLATTEGTLVASYNRGMKIANMNGGIKTTVLDDRMQRAPVFVFSSARDAKKFAEWVDENFENIKKSSESTSNFVKLLDIEKYMVSKFAFLRFNYSTGDAAGQNMVSKATFEACNWIVDNYEDIKHSYLESNMATDKKGSQLNILRTRGKRVVAEIVVDREILEKHLYASPEAMIFHSRIGNIGAMISGANNNGLHSANSLAAMFIATGQDVANIAESSAGTIYSEILDDGSIYVSLTIPSLIVASYGGGTGLPTQKECLEMMGCYGKGKVMKLAEIVAAVALAGEMSLAAAISSLDWVSSHERYGKNR